MDNYEETFKSKLHYAMQMVGTYGTYKVPLDFWEVWVKEGDMGKTFRPKNLKEMFPDYYERILKACSVTETEDKKGITFIANELTGNNTI